MSRPQISDDLTQVVEEIHREETGTRPSSFEEALETVVQMADHGLGEDGWYPGKYAGKAFERVLGGNNAESSVQNRVQQQGSLVSQVSVVDPDRQAVFKQILEDDYTVTIPEVEQTALSLTPGEVLQVIAYPAGSSDNVSEEENSDE
ncbi:hypothetical protein HALDL1_03760 [Halobacterium sp. DL1]|jgi:hypothetical protein|nr:hypothetical protein HALDL1_03760 [Halobacterium sp. DL1]